MHQRYALSFFSTKAIGLALTSLAGIFLVLIFSGCRGEPEPKSTVPEKAEPAAVSSPAGSVWKVQGKGTLYLCGTMHVLREKDHPLPATYQAAYQLSQAIIQELPPGSASSPVLYKRMEELGTLEPGTTLQQLLSEKDWQQVEAWVKKRGLNADIFNRYRPWFVALIMVSTEYQANGARADLGVDQHFEELALKDGKTARGLETIEQQLQLFASTSAEQQLELLHQTFGEIDTMTEVFEEMVGNWRSGNLEALNEQMFREAEKFPDLMESFLFARNRAWIPALKEALNQDMTTMVLVGAGHLGGEEGLLKLLEKEGYQVSHFTGQ